MIFLVTNLLNLRLESETREEVRSTGSYTDETCEPSLRSTVVEVPGDRSDGLRNVTSHRDLPTHPSVQKLLDDRFSLGTSVDRDTGRVLYLRRRSLTYVREGRVDVVGVTVRLGA